MAEANEKETLTRDSKYVQDLKKENSTLRKLIIKEEETIKELKEDMNYLLQILKLAGKEACEILSIEVSDENISEYIDELCSQLEEGA